MCPSVGITAQEAAQPAEEQMTKGTACCQYRMKAAAEASRAPREMRSPQTSTLKYCQGRSKIAYKAVARMSTKVTSRDHRLSEQLLAPIEKSILQKSNYQRSSVQSKKHY